MVSLSRRVLLYVVLVMVCPTTPPHRSGTV
jgi:hypothetical protein